MHRIRQDYERNERGIHSQQKPMYLFLGHDEHREVLQILRDELGKKFDKLEYIQDIIQISGGGQYFDRMYFVDEDSECKFNNTGDCVGHKEIKHYLAQGYLPIDDQTKKDTEGDVFSGTKTANI